MMDFGGLRINNVFLILVRRCKKLIEEGSGRALEFPHSIRLLLYDSLAYRDRFFASELTTHGLKIIAGKLTRKLDELTRRKQTHDGNRRLAKFLRKHLRDIFEFLHNPNEVSASNNESEYELRYNVIARKLSGGNRSVVGLRAQETLPSSHRVGM